jgi:hypothetical protein
MACRTTHDRSLYTAAIRAVRVRLASGALLGLIAVTGIYAIGASAEEKKPDWWCGVIEKQIDQNREESRKPHDSNGTERLREERRRLDKDAHDRHCPGH